MILQRVRVQNFRSLRDVEVSFGRQSAILGGNGAGKSTILRAIERFYASSANVEGDDFFNRRLDQPIRITLTFVDFNEDEQDRFGDRIRDGVMSVTRVFEAHGGRNNGRYFGTTLQYPPFADVRAIDGAVPRRAAFNELAGGLGLPRANNAGELDELMSRYEQEHPDECEERTDDGAFFGFANVARGNLQKSTSFVFIPAVREASSESTDTRGGAVSRLMDLVVRSAVQRRADVRAFQQRVTGEYLELVDPARLPELNGLAETLTGTLRDYYADAGVALRWQPPEEFGVPLPKADALLEEDGFEGPVDRKGHGLQRAFILTLLQHLARAGSADLAAVEGEQLDGDVAQPDDLEPYVLPGLILAIEEPELYQHPTKQRHFAKVLSRLSDGSLPGVAAQTQVMFASHSPLFVSLDRFDEVRLAKRLPTGPDGEKECHLTSSTLGRVVRRLEAAHDVTHGTFTEQGLRGRLHIIGAELAEGFFADMVVLVEGISDKAALVAAAALEDFDFEASGIAVLWVDGKTKLDRPTAIFQELGVPTYLLFDCDNEQGADAATNRALQRLMDEPVVTDSKLHVGERYSCFQRRLEHQLKADLTDAVFDQSIAHVQANFGIRRDEVLKTPSAMTEALRLAAAQGARSATLSQIIGHIRNVRAAR